jgi:hypothetical protein
VLHEQQQQQLLVLLSAGMLPSRHARHSAA